MWCVLIRGQYLDLFPGNWEPLVGHYSSPGAGPHADMFCTLVGQQTGPFMLSTPLKWHHSGHFSVFYWTFLCQDTELRCSSVHQLVFSESAPHNSLCLRPQHGGPSVTLCPHFALAVRFTGYSRGNIPN